MLWRPRFGALGLVGLPYLLLFGALGPLVESLGYFLYPLAASLGLGMILSVVSVLVEDASLRRYPRASDVVVLLGAAIVEQLVQAVYRSGESVGGLGGHLRGERYLGLAEAGACSSGRGSHGWPRDARCSAITQ